MTLIDTPLMGGRVKGAMQRVVPQVKSVLVHMEHWRPETVIYDYHDGACPDLLK
jgi:hypothetical protein